MIEKAPGAQRRALGSLGLALAGKALRPAFAPYLCDLAAERAGMGLGRTFGPGKGEGADWCSSAALKICANSGISAGEIQFMGLPDASSTQTRVWRENPRSRISCSTPNGPATSLLRYTQYCAIVISRSPIP